MILSILGLTVLAGLATYGSVETIHHSSLFNRLRAWAETADGWVATVIRCPHCLSYWVAGFFAAVSLVGLTAKETELSWWSLVCVWLLLTFASRKLAGLMNDGFYGSERSHIRGGHEE